MQLSQAQTALQTDEVSEPIQVAADEAAVAADKVSVSEAQTNLKDATLTSPVPGTVITLDISSGQTVSAGSTTVTGDPPSSGSSAGTGSSSTGGTGLARAARAVPGLVPAALVRAALVPASTGSSGTGSGSTGASSTSSTEVVIEPLNSFVVDADVTTSQITQLQLGQQAVITPTGTSTTAYGVVSSISQVGSTTSGVTTFPVTISVTGAPTGIYAGASADVEIVVTQVNNVLVVPTTAVHTVGTASFVYLLKNGKEVEQQVVAGASGGAYTQVKSGLKSRPGGCHRLSLLPDPFEHQWRHDRVWW